MSTTANEYLELFSERSTYYNNYRPQYATQLFCDLQHDGIITPSSTVADIGCGTGIFSQQLINTIGCTVFGVEPNNGMQEHLSPQLTGNDHFRLRTGAAEKTNLPDSSVDVIVSAQAFHWFNPDRFAIECKRILRDSANGWICLTWNVKQLSEIETERKKIVEQYRDVLDNYACSWDERGKGIAAFFGNNYRVRSYKNPIINTKEQFIKRTLSASHALLETDERFPDYLQAWEHYFDIFAVEGVITIPNETVVYYGHVA